MVKRIYLLVLAAFALTLSAQNKEQENNAIRKLGIAQYAISHLYVDSVNAMKLTEGAITGMLSQLDPHSTYTDAAQTKAFNEPLRGDFEGIGVQFNMIEDTLVVIQPTDKGPSQKVGIMAGDRIVRVNDTVIAGVKKSTDVIMKMLRGKKGTTVHLGIIRPGVKEEIKFDVVRDKIPLHTLDASYMIDSKTGYIRFGSFGQKTPEEIRTAMKALKEKGMDRIIIDLRSNGGGFMEAAVQIASEFLQEGDMVVYTKGRAVPSAEYKARGGGMFTKGKIVVLIDEFSASAAEILAGALQDNDRAAIVGVRSFGKGLVQQPVQLPDGSMIRLTVSALLHSGRALHTKTIQAGRERSLQPGRVEPPAQRRTLSRRQHSPQRLSEVLHAQKTSRCVWRRRHYTRLFRASRHHDIHKILSQSLTQESHSPDRNEIHRQKPQQSHGKLS